MCLYQCEIEKANLFIYQNIYFAYLLLEGKPFLAVKKYSIAEKGKMNFAVVLDFFIRN